MLYDVQIQRLNWIIRNWENLNIESVAVHEDFFEKFDSNLYLHLGLCYNAKLNFIDHSHLQEIYLAFPGYSGIYTFPLDNFENFECVFNFTETPERLELAKHLVEHLSKF